ncbi:MAG: PD-(D/E)XK nuclease family protein [bacterium]|nr:PD-(D/E)XK nuclease family protein [bacterium]
MPPYARRTRNIYDPASSEPFKLSRSKLDLFLNCPRCFYLDRRLGIAPPPGPAFTLNVAVDVLLKKEFDIHRAQGTPHPLMHAYGLKAVPFRDPRMGVWRENFVGVQHLHTPTNFLVFGAVDDLWVADEGTMIHVVDYKATSKDGEVELGDTKWHNQYRRQMEVYQWLLRKNGLTISDTGYFVYVNGKKDRAAFDGRLEFDVKLIPYRGSDGWVEGALTAAAACLNGHAMPAASAECEFCAYRALAVTAEKTIT